MRHILYEVVRMLKVHLAVETHKKLPVRHGNGVVKCIHILSDSVYNIIYIIYYIVCITGSKLKSPRWIKMILKLNVRILFPEPY